MEQQELKTIMSAFKLLDRKLTEQTSIVTAMAARIKRLELQNAKLAKMIEANSSSASMEQPQGALLMGDDRTELDHRLKSIEDKSAKAVELLRANAVGGGRKRSWPL